MLQIVVIIVTNEYRPKTINQPTLNQCINVV